MIATLTITWYELGLLHEAIEIPFFISESVVGVHGVLRI